MPGWKIQAAKRVDMPEDIADGLWVSIYHPKMLPLDAAKKFLAMAPKKNETGAAAFDLDTGIDLANTIILDWNLPGKDGAILKLPSQDPNVWKQLPALTILTEILKALGEGVKDVEPDPNSSNG